MQKCHLSCKLINTGWISTFARAPSSDDDYDDYEHYHDGDDEDDVNDIDKDDDYDDNNVEDLDM